MKGANTTTSWNTFSDTSFKRMSSSDSQDAAPILASQAEQLLLINRPKDALPLIHRALSQDPENRWAAHLRAWAYYDLDKTEEADEAVQKALSIQPDSEWGHRLRCLIELYLKRDVIEAHRAAIEAVRCDPESIDAHHVLFSVEITRQLYAAARRTARTLQRLAPEHALAYACLGRLAMATNDSALAERHFRAALARDPENPFHFFYLGNALQEQHRLDEATDSYFTALKLRPTNPGFKQAFQDTALKAAEHRRDDPNGVLPYNLMIPFDRSREGESLRFEDFRLTLLRVESLYIGVERTVYLHFQLDRDEDRQELLYQWRADEAFAQGFTWKEKGFNLIMQQSNLFGKMPYEMLIVQTTDRPVDASAAMTTGFQWRAPQILPVGSGEWIILLSRELTVEEWCRILSERGALVEDVSMGKGHVVVAGHEVTLQMDTQRQALFYWERDEAQMEIFRGLLGDTVRTVANCWFNSIHLAVDFIRHLAVATPCLVLDNRGPKNLLYRPGDLRLSTIEKQVVQLQDHECEQYVEKDLSGRVIYVWNWDGTPAEGQT